MRWTLLWTHIDFKFGRLSQLLIGDSRTPSHHLFQPGRRQLGLTAWREVTPADKRDLQLHNVSLALASFKACGSSVVSPTSSVEAYTLSHEQTTTLGGLTAHALR